MKYWEMVDAKVKKENAPMFRNHRKLIPPPQKKFEKREYKSEIPLWVQVCSQPVGKIYSLRHFNNQFWIKHYNEASKIFCLKENHKLSKRDYIKYCWDRKDEKIFVNFNSVILLEEWNLHIFPPQIDGQNRKKLYFTTNYYVNVQIKYF
jgi:hypothetical protein